ncbi:MAG: hypothetical protein IJI14_03360 [Anaerolineaceae bacterium]|nr:hypothetical protein [Anaerolineaceae bacterium]
MKYDRNSMIYGDMSCRLRDKFYETYNIRPYWSNGDDRYEFDECLKHFIKSNPYDSELRYLCEIYPDLHDIPHPDRIPESWGLTQKGREIMKNGYIEKIEDENAELHVKNDELKKQYDDLTDNCSNLEERLAQQQKANSVLTDENAELKVHNEELKQEYADISNEKASLTDEMNALKTDYLNLSDANDELKKVISELTEENDYLKDDLSKLRIDFVNLRAEKDELKNNLSFFQAMVENVTNENTELKSKLSESTSQITASAKIISGYEYDITESEKEFSEPEVQQEHLTTCNNDPVDNSSDVTPVSIYQKFFITPLVKNRYRQLTENEKDWVLQNVSLSEMETKIFELCCEHESLKDVSEITGVNYSKIKRFSTMIVDKIRITVRVR